MAIDPRADREDLEPGEESDTEAAARASNEGMLAPEEDPETWGELEAEKLDDRDDATGTESADISGPAPGDD